MLARERMMHVQRMPRLVPVTPHSAPHSDVLLLPLSAVRCPLSAVCCLPSPADVRYDPAAAKLQFSGLRFG
jgi:hypothetical protein